MMNLTQLADNFGSDKGTIAGSQPHRYTHLYDLIFYPFRDQQFNLLEMGLAVGGPEVGGPVDRRVSSPSIEMWSEYFPHAQIYGFDISDFSHLTYPRFQFIRGDSGSAADIATLCEAAPHFDIIIDDASHASFHQQLALKMLWAKLAHGGLYVLEDLQWQSPPFEAALPTVPKTAEMMQSAFETGVYTPNDLLDEDFMSLLKRESYSYSAFHAFDGTAGPLKQIILRKR